MLAESSNHAARAAAAAVIIFHRNAFDFFRVAVGVSKELIDEFHCDECGAGALGESRGGFCAVGIKTCENTGERNHGLLST
jgi:hypothetical protein